MKKNFMMTAVLLGALTLGACVDDNESASVTAVRNAKAEQLIALGEAAKAQAEAAKIEAQAAAELAAAQAEYQKALAAAAQAEAEYQAELTRQAQEKFAIELEQIKAEAEAAIAAAKLELAESEQALLDQADEKLQALYWEYAEALGASVDYQDRKIELSNLIAQAQAGLTSVEEQTEIAVAYWQREIDILEAELALYEEYEGADVAELKKIRNEAYFEWQKAQDVKAQKYQAYSDAQTALSTARNNFYYYNESDIKTVQATAALRGENEYNISWYDVLVSEFKTLVENDYTSISVPYYTLKASEVEIVKQQLEANVTSRKETLGTESDDETKSSLYGQLASQEKQKAAALEADENADVTSFDNQIAVLKLQIEECKQYLADDEGKLAVFTTAIASFEGEDLKAYDAAIVELTKVAEAYATAYEEYRVAFEAVNTAYTKYDVAYNLADQADVQGIIDNLEVEILQAKARQEAWKNEVINQETAIAQYQAELATVEAQLAAIQAIIDNLKAQIDDALAE